MTKHVLTPLIDRITAKVEITESGCWEWTGATSCGYGVVGLGRRADGTGQVHRVLWEMLVGPVAPGLHLDHLCCNRVCCNPDHLEPVTQAENNRRAALTRRLNLATQSRKAPAA